MKRMHIGMKVDDLDDAIAFYSRLFGAEPTLKRDDYAKWMLDDPRVNFSIDLHGDGPPGRRITASRSRRRTSWNRCASMSMPRTWRAATRTT